MIPINRILTVSAKSLEKLARLLILMAGIGTIPLDTPELGAAPGAEEEEYQAAMQATIEIVRKHKACPTDPAAFDKFVAEVFPMLYPQLANREREKDPEYLKRLAAVKEEIEQAKQRETEALKDPAVRAQREQSLRAFLSKKSAREIEDAVIRQAELVRQREQELQEAEKKKPVSQNPDSETTSATP